MPLLVATERQYSGSCLVLSIHIHVSLVVVETETHGEELSVNRNVQTKRNTDTAKK